MATNLFLEAFGHLSPHQAVIVVEEEDLYSVFRERSELMGWSTMDTPPRPLFWDMHEAELTAGQGLGRIGWIQVGLASRVIGTRPVRPPRTPGWAAWPESRHNAVTSAQVVPALCQCLEDALQRFGACTLTGFQLTVSYLETHPPPQVPDISGHNWFNLIPKQRTAAFVAFDHAWLGGPTTQELIARLQQNTGSCKFGPMVPLSVPHRITVPDEAPVSPLPALVPARCGVAVTLPEWTASAVGWAMAFVLDRAHTLAPHVRHFALRVTRMG